MHTPSPETGFIRLPSVLAPRGPLAISRSSWFEGINDGIYPKSVKLAPRIAAWRIEVIRALEVLICLGLYKNDSETIRALVSWLNERSASDVKALIDFAEQDGTAIQAIVKWIDAGGSNASAS